MNTIEKSRQALEGIKDPELGFSIVDLGLIYDISYHEPTRTISITMTLTSPICPEQDFFQKEIEQRLLGMGVIQHVQVTFTFEPRWSAEKAALFIQEHFTLLGIPLSR